MTAAGTALSRPVTHPGRELSPAPSLCGCSTWFRSESGEQTETGASWPGAELLPRLGPPPGRASGNLSGHRAERPPRGFSVAISVGN